VRLLRRVPEPARGPAESADKRAPRAANLGETIGHGAGEGETSVSNVDEKLCRLRDVFRGRCMRRSPQSDPVGTCGISETPRFKSGARMLRLGRKP